MYQWIWKFISYRCRYNGLPHGKKFTKFPPMAIPTRRGIKDYQ